jgi:hypothetical protein
VRSILDNNTWKLPLDTSASALTHSVVEETHIVNGGIKVVIYPHWGGFYENTIYYFNTELNTDNLFDTVKSENVIIKPLQLDVELTALTGKPVYKCFTLDLTNFVGSYTFKINYQTPGGDSLTNNFVLDQIASSLFDEKIIDYKNILGLPENFDFKDHTEKAQLAYGLSQLKSRLDSISSVLDTKDESHNRMHEYIVQLFLEKFKIKYAEYADTLVQKDSNGVSVKDNIQKLIAGNYSSQAVDLLPSINEYQRLYSNAIAKCDSLNIGSPLYKQVLDWVINYQWWDATKKLGDLTNSNSQLYYKSITASIHTGSFYVVGDSIGKIFKSTNLVSWTDLNSPFTTQINGFYYDGSRYLIYTSNGQVASTIDFTSYTMLTTEATGVWYGTGILDMVYTGTKYILLFIGTNAVWSTTNFTGPSNITITNTSGSYTARTMCKNGNTIILIGDAGSYAYSNDNGETWSLKTVGYSILKVKPYGAGFIAVGSGGNILTSTDGSTWVLCGANIAGKKLIEVDFSDPFITVVAEDGTIYTAASITGSWTKQYTPSIGLTIRTLAKNPPGSPYAVFGYRYLIRVNSVSNVDVAGNKWNILDTTSEPFDFIVSSMPTLLDSEVNEVTSVKEALRLKGNVSPYNNDTGMCLHVSSSCAFLTENQVLNNAKLDITFKNWNSSLVKTGAIPFSNENAYLNSVKLNSTTTNVYTSRDIVLGNNSIFYRKTNNITAGTIDSSTEGFSLFAVLKYDPQKSFTLLSHIDGDLYIASHPDTGKAIGIYNIVTGKWIAYKYAPFRPKQDTIIGISFNIALKHLHFYVPDEKFTPDQKCSVDYFDQTALNQITKFDPLEVMPTTMLGSHPLSYEANQKRVLKQFTLFNKPVSVPVFMMCHKKFLYAHYAGLNNKNPLVAIAKHDVKFYQ